MKTLQIICAVLLLLARLFPGIRGRSARTYVSGLKQRGYVVVFRHVATDDSQKDIYRFR